MGHPTQRVGPKAFALLAPCIAFPDARLTTLNSVAEGDWVVVRCTYRGTYRGTSRFPVDGGMLVAHGSHFRDSGQPHVTRARRQDRGALRESGRYRNDAATCLVPPPSLPGQ